MKRYNVKDMDIVVCDNGKFVILPHGEAMPEKISDRLNCEIKIAANKLIGLGNGGFELKEQAEKDSGILLTYECTDYGLRLVTELLFSHSSGIVVQQNTITNIGDSDIMLTSFSSGVMEYCAYDSKCGFSDLNTNIHICHNKWQGEAQWQSYHPSEIGVYPSTTHCWERANWRIDSHGSWSTCDYYPLVLVENSEKETIYFMETEGSHNWYIKVGTYGGYNNNSGITLESSGADECNGNWFKNLLPGESYTAERCFIGMMKGNFESAVSALNTFKRSDSTVSFENKIPPICFNVYMNCIWGDPRPERLIPLIDKAAEAGCEIFIIDGGWCSTALDSFKESLGDWIPKDEFYSKISLKQIADKIRSSGMIPGIWFELDACDNKAYGYRPNDEFLLTRHGKAVGEKRAFYNFCNPKVREYIFKRVNDIYDMGFRYIKNDYNQSTGIGCTNYDDSCAEGLRRNSDAFYEFIDTLYGHFPDLVIENCSSGALRDDNKILRRSYLQSTSDQEIYINNPSIVSGSLAVMPPEKAGIWSYPYPVSFNMFKKFELNDEYISEMADGTQTVFNMVTSMLGVMYLSGRIDLCDETNFVLICDGIKFYKNMRNMISTAHPIYPCGTLRINSRQNFAVGLETDEYILLTAWNIGCSDMHFNVNLSKYTSDSACIKATYSVSDTNCNLVDNVIKIDFSSSNNAVAILISK